MSDHYCQSSVVWDQWGIATKDYGKLRNFHHGSEDYFFTVSSCHVKSRKSVVIVIIFVRNSSVQSGIFMLMFFMDVTKMEKCLCLFFVTMCMPGVLYTESAVLQAVVHAGGVHRGSTRHAFLYSLRPAEVLGGE